MFSKVILASLNYGQGSDYTNVSFCQRSPHFLLLERPKSSSNGWEDGSWEENFGGRRYDWRERGKEEMDCPNGSLERSGQASWELYLVRKGVGVHCKIQT